MPDPEGQGLPPADLGVSIADVLNAPAEPQEFSPAPEPPPPEAEVEQAEEPEFADQLLAAEGTSPEVPAESETPAADPLADLRAQYDSQIAELRAELKVAQQPRPPPFYVPPPAPQSQATFDQRVEQRIQAIAQRHGYDVRDPALRMHAEEQVHREDLAKQYQQMQATVQEAQIQSIVAKNQREMDEAFFRDPVMSKIAQSNEKGAAQLYETAFAIWLAQGGTNARGAVAALRNVISQTAEGMVSERLSSIKAKAAARPIAAPSGRTASLARLPPGQTSPKFKPRNPAKAVDEAAEQADRYLRAIGVE